MISAPWILAQLWFWYFMKMVNWRKSKKIFYWRELWLNVATAATAPIAAATSAPRGFFHPILIRFSSTGTFLHGHKNLKVPQVIWSVLNFFAIDNGLEDGSERDDGDGDGRLRRIRHFSEILKGCQGDQSLQVQIGLKESL